MLLFSPQFIQEMAAAWQATIDQQLGIFAEDEDEVNPLMASDEHVPEVKQPHVAAHRIWLKVCVNIFTDDVFVCKANPCSQY